MEHQRGEYNVVRRRTVEVTPFGTILFEWEDDELVNRTYKINEEFVVFIRQIVQEELRASGRE